MRKLNSIRVRPARALLLVLLISLLLPSPSFTHVAIEEQIEELSRRIDAHPGDAVLYLRRGELRRAHAEWRGAMSDYRRALRLDPELDAVDLCRASLRVDQGRPARALSPLDRFLAVRPDHAAARLLRGRILAALGRQREAADELARGIAAFVPPQAPQPDDYIALARALAAAGRDGADEAVAKLDEGMRVLGPIVTLQLAAIDLDVASGRYDAALRRVEEASARSGRRETWLVKRASILESAGRDAEARAVRAAVAASGPAPIPSPGEAGP